MSSTFISEHLDARLRSAAHSIATKASPSIAATLSIRTHLQALEVAAGLCETRARWPCADADAALAAARADWSAYALLDTYPGEQQLWPRVAQADTALAHGLGTRSLPEIQAAARALDEALRDLELLNFGQQERLAKLIQSEGGRIGALALGMDALGALVTLIVGIAVLRFLRRYATLLEERAIRDELTGLLNRRGFFERAGPILARGNREGSEAMLFFADIDDLKRVNDELGHLAGDALIREATETLAEVFAPSDLLARIGGDEFVAIALNASEATREAFAQHLLRALETRNARPGRTFTLAISLGFIHCPPGGAESLESLIRRADQRMYDEKRTRKRLTSSG